MSPEVGFVRKGRKSSARLLMCSAVRERSSFTLAVASGCSETQETRDDFYCKQEVKKRRKSAHTHL